LLEGSIVQDLQDEDLMRRFLLGESGDKERELVEDRFLTDPAYFEALCALEDELILSHIRGDLPQRWRRPFDVHVLASPARRRRVEEAERLHQSLSSSRRQPGRGAKRTLWTSPISLWMAVAAGIFGVVFSGWLIGRRTASDREAAIPSPTNRSQPVALATFVLAPGLTRSELGASNVFRVEPGIPQIRLQFSAPAGSDGTLRTVLRPVGGESIQVPAEPEFRRDGNRVDVSWVVAAPLLPRGDYLLTLLSEAPAGQREPLASRFFSIVQ
jgi:hypothetical protein